MNTKILSLILAIFLFLGGVNDAAAQFYTTSSSLPVVTTGCVNLPISLAVRYRSPDVLRYQNFLISQGYLAAGYATGYFGGLTFAATRRFQANNGIRPTGFVGSLTRAKIYALSCNGGVVPPVNQAPVITSISPSTGPFGTQITIYGRNFNRTSNAVNFAGINNIVTNIPSYDGVSMQFTVPASLCAQGATYCPAIALSPGSYQISVTNSSGTSNSVTFLAVGSGTSDRPIVNGIDGPTALSVGQQGTWVVRATDSTGGGLSYQVLWGDEGLYGSYYVAAATFTQTATFTHVYNQSGSYTPTFIVRGSNGLTSQTSLTVQVGGGSTTIAPTISNLSPSSGPVGTTVTVTGNNFTRYDNKINFAGVNNAVTGIPSYNGTTLQFNIPGTPCAYGTYCAQVVLAPGTYPVSVSNPNGTSNSLNFVVTSQSTTTVNQTVTLALDQTSNLVNDLQITPVSIIEDSRCAIGVYCIQAGRVVVRTYIRTNTSQNTVDLAVGQVYVTPENYRIEITEVLPLKYYNQSIAYHEYRITYKVTR